MQCCFCLEVMGSVKLSRKLKGVVSSKIENSQGAF